MKRLLAFILITASFSWGIPVLAETYEAGEFTIILDVDYDEGKTYYVCDRQERCVYLVHGTSWQNQGCRGITWENQGYTYSVSWQEGNDELPLLKVYNSSDRLILERSMQLKTE